MSDFKTYPIPDIYSLGEAFEVKDSQTGFPYIENLIERADFPEKYPIVETNFPSLDKAIGGLRAGTLNVIVARPGTGKTNFLINVLKNTCVLNDHVGLFFSIEMPHNEVIDRLVAMCYDIPLSEILSLKFSDKSRQKLESLKKTRGEPFKNIHIFTTNLSKRSGRPSLETLLEKTKDFLFYNRGCRLIFIDYIQLVKVIGERNVQRYEAVGKITEQLTNLCKDDGVSILALCQAGREADKKRKPSMSDIRESGNIENDAHSILFLERSKITGEKDGDLRRFKITLLKNRHGASSFNEFSVFLDTSNLIFKEKK